MYTIQSNNPNDAGTYEINQYFNYTSMNISYKV